MSLAGFKKQLNKANQYVSEKIGGAKGTELDDEFVEMERKIDVMGNLVNELMARTHEHLQPNPASRAKLSAVKSISKLRGQANVLLYPQPEGQLGECMVKFGKDLGDDSLFGAALCEAGEAYKQLADIKYGLEDNVKQNFIEPLHHIQTKDLKEVNHHRKKLSGRRLDFDCKRRKQVKGATGAPAGGPQVSEEEIGAAAQKFEESQELTERAMFNLLENDVEQISALASFIEAEVNFHRQSADILQGLHEVLQERIQEAANRPRREHVPKRITSFSSYDRTPSPSHGANHDKTGNNFDIADHGGYSLSPAPPSYNQSTGGSREDINNGDPFGVNDPFDPFGSVGSASSTQSRNDTHADYASIDWSKKKSGGGGGQQPHCEALYDFEPENEGELGFKEGDIIQLTARIDENWYEGSLRGVGGFFPVNYVKVIVDVP